MIYVFNRKLEQVKELTEWDPGLLPRECYLLDSKGRVYHYLLSRLKQLYPYEWPATVRATRMILGFNTPS